MNVRQKLRLKFGAVVILAILAGLISYPQAVSKIPKLYDFFNKPKINLGLDLQGGIHLEYKADLSQVDPAKQKEAMQAMQDAVERKINAFGVAEPVIYTTKSGDEQRLIVELAGIRDINEAKKRIGEMPFLEFKEEEETAVEKIPEEQTEKKKRVLMEQRLHRQLQALAARLLLWWSPVRQWCQHWWGRLAEWLKRIEDRSKQQKKDLVQCI